jgi:hypothetical protein
MIVEQMNRMLRDNDGSALHFMLPSGEFVPPHFHVTEVGRVQKAFIDCGGTRREAVSCVLQLWTAEDVDHRILAGKLSAIMTLAKPLLGSDDLPVEVEYGPNVAAHYWLSDIESTPNGLLFVLAGKQTECLAPDKCGVPFGGKPGCC